MKQACRLGIIVTLLTLTLVGCGDPPADGPATSTDDDTPLVVYSGRNESLIGPLLEHFTAETGQQVEIRYGGTSELLATLLEEGDNSPADLFLAQDAGALGALSARGMLVPLPEAVLDRLPSAFRSGDGDWVGLSGRARVVVYNTELITPEELPERIGDLADERYRGKFGVAPTNASFQAHMAYYAAVNGDEALGELLEAMQSNEPQRYPKNSPIVEAVITGEIEWGLVNHYYLWRVFEERPDVPARNFFMSGDDGSRFVNMSGIGAISDRPGALKLVEFLLSDDAQIYFSEETFEYPLVPGIPSPIDLPLLGDDLPQVDYRQVALGLEPTLARIHESGLMSFN